MMDFEAKARELLLGGPHGAARVSRVNFGSFDALIKDVTTALREAVAAERETCAELAAKWKSPLRPGTEARLFGHQEAAREIAEDIRARGDIK